MVDSARKPGLKEVPLSKAKDGLFDKRLQRDERFLRRIESARKSLRAGRGVRLEDVEC